MDLNTALIWYQYHSNSEHTPRRCAINCNYKPSLLKTDTVSLLFSYQYGTNSTWFQYHTNTLSISLWYWIQFVLIRQQPTTPIPLNTNSKPCYLHTNANVVWFKYHTDILPVSTQCGTYSAL